MTDIVKAPESSGVAEVSEISGFMEALKKEGFTNMRLSVNRRKSLALAVQCQELKYYECGDSRIYFIEALWNGEYCCAYAGSLEEQPEIFRQLKETAGVFGKREAPEEIKESRDLRGKRWRDIDREKVTDILKCAESEALACEKADFVEVCEYSQFEETITLIDGNGNYLTDDNGDCCFTIRVIAREGDSVSASDKFGIVNAQDEESFRKISCNLARRAAKYARFGLHASEIASGSYPIVLENCVMAELTGQYIPMFYSENVRHNTSALAGRQNQKIGCSFLRLEEDPFSSRGTCRRRIDDEGVPVVKKTLIKNGMFENVLYSKKDAAEEGKISTGNGFKTDITSDMGTRATNVILSSGEDVFSRKQMIEAAEGGIYITKIEGAFAGTDVKSGDFSLLASGNRIENGRVCGALNQFTISGNICELWQDIEMIGDDAVYRMTDGVCVLSPSVKVKKLVVSGK